MPTENPAAPNVRGIDITTYLVKDVERATAFYRDTIGLKVTREYGGQGAEFAFDDGTTFGLWKLDDGPWYPSHGVMFAVDDFEAALAYYRAHGVKIADETEDTPGCYMAFAEDPEGNTFVIHQRKGGRD